MFADDAVHREHHGRWGVIPPIAFAFVLRHPRVLGHEEDDVLVRPMTTMAGRHLATRAIECRLDGNDMTMILRSSQSNDDDDDETTR